MNTLYHGGDLKVLLEDIKDETVDSFYLDPSFNSQRYCKAVPRNRCVNEGDSQKSAFEYIRHRRERG